MTMASVDVYFAPLRQKLLSYSQILSLKDIVKFTLCFRVALWLLMATVCAIFPSHNPGDDVVRFPVDDSPFMANYFAESDTFCACRFHCSWKDASTGYVESTNPPNALQSHVYPFLLRPLTRWDAARFLRLALRPQLYLPPPTNHTTTATEESEMAHAFFPGFPMVVQSVTRFLLSVAPRGALPSTCAGVIVLASILCNLLAFLIALMALHKTTSLLLHRHGHHLEPKLCLQYTNCVTLLFVLNPASVFFGTAYSESLFAAMVFSGSYSMLRWGPLGALIPWTLATTIRSNGIIYMGYLFLYAGGKVCEAPRRGLVHILLGVLVAFSVLFPMYHHNRLAIGMHCHDASAATSRYEWCATATSSHTFSLYAYIQRKHWNVGFLRYYEIKQIPNFLLAAPILCLSAFGVADWIYRSWLKVASADQKPLPSQALYWVCESLRAFAGPPTSSMSVDDILVGNPVLGHYAVWAVAALLGLTTAHVQITTRLLCSTCPALYWYVAHVVMTSARWGGVYLGYSLLFIVLGGVLHPLWLPWT